METCEIVVRVLWKVQCTRKNELRFTYAVSGALKDEDFTNEYVQLHHTDTGETMTFENKGERPLTSVKESQEDKSCLIRQEEI